MTVFGTRPEAIKMAPIIKKLENYPAIESLVCVTAQHREMLDQVLQIFEIQPDFDLNVMSSNQTLIELFSKIMVRLEPILLTAKPDVILVHGDTTTTLATTMTAFYLHIPVMHVEAGLRTYNLQSPWPEEAHRHLTSIISVLHFAPSNYTAQNLYTEHIDPKKVIVTGNTVIDALFMARDKIEQNTQLASTFAEQFDFLDSRKKLILLTVHRRENLGKGINSIIHAVQRLAAKYPQVQFVIPVHLNPNVKKPIVEALSDIANVFLIAPQDYLPFVWLMTKSTIILTDSGGIQEEAPSLNVPVLVMRDTTERQEAVRAGTVKLIGTHTETIVSEVSLLLENNQVYQKISNTPNPYGDGKASDLIIAAIENYFHHHPLSNS